MGEIVSGRIHKHGGNRKTNQVLSSEDLKTTIRHVATELSLGHATVERWQLASRLNRRANFDDHLAEYRDDETGHNLALMTFLADIRRMAPLSSNFNWRTMRP